MATCTACAGTGHPVVARGSGLDRDLNNVCTVCGGTGMVSDPPAQRSRSSGNGGESGGGGQSGPCFIATAVFESTDGPELTTLRRFRDETLLTTRPGRWLVAGYYRVGPYLARGISRRPRTKALVRRALEHLCQRIARR